MGPDSVATEMETLLRRTDALQSGHFVLSSGLHSSQYVQCALLLQHPDLAALASGMLADKFRPDRTQVVIAPAMGGIIVAYEVARALGVRALYAERVNGDFALRRSLQIHPGERTLVVEDVVTTGRSIREVLQLVDQAGGVTVGVGALVDRSPHPLKFPARFEALLKLSVDVYSPPDCPLCRQALPLTKPGSRPVAVSRL